MRRVIVTAACVLAGSGMGVAAATAGTAVGTLAGQTQISYGCPGPVAEGGPSCNPWRTFAQARFSVSPSASGRIHIVVSDSLGRFSLRLAPGNYTVTSLPQGAHTGRNDAPDTHPARRPDADRRSLPGLPDDGVTAVAVAIPALSASALVAAAPATPTG